MATSSLQASVPPCALNSHGGTRLSGDMIGTLLSQLKRSTSSEGGEGGGLHLREVYKHPGLGWAVEGSVFLATVCKIAI